MTTNMKPVLLTDFLDIGDMFEMSVVLEMTPTAWISCF